MPKDLVIYHSRCADGISASYAAYYGAEECHDVDGFEAYEFYPGIYSDPPPDVTGRDVYLVDFSYKRDVILEMAKKAKKITIIDHHKSAIEDLVDLPDNVYTHFDTNYSGAYLAWDYFVRQYQHENIDLAKPAPYWIHLIQDRDLWQFRYPETKDFTTGLVTKGILNWDLKDVFRLFDGFRDGDDVTFQQIIELGKAVNKYKEQSIQSILKNKRMGYIAGHLVPIVNSSEYQSELGNILSVGYPFAAVYCESSRHRIYSLRSQKEDQGGLDVSKIAQEFAGGGHREAAGFKVPFDHDLILSDHGQLNAVFVQKDELLLIESSMFKKAVFFN